MRLESICFHLFSWEVRNPNPFHDVLINSIHFMSFDTELELAELKNEYREVDVNV